MHVYQTDSGDVPMAEALLPTPLLNVSNTLLLSCTKGTFSQVPLSSSTVSIAPATVGCDM